MIVLLKKNNYNLIVTKKLLSETFYYPVTGGLRNGIII